MSDIGRFQKWTKIWEVGYVPWPQHTAKGKDFELTPTAKMETGHPEEGYFGREFRVICNHCGVKAAWSRNTCKFWAIFAFFSKRRPLTVNFQNSVPKVFTASLVDRCCCVQISWKVADRKSTKSCVIYRTKNKQNFGCLSNCRYCTDRAQSLPGPAPNNVLTVLQTSSKSVHFQRSYSRTHRHRFGFVEYFQDRFFEPIMT